MIIMVINHNTKFNITSHNIHYATNSIEIIDRPSESSDTSISK